MALSEESSKWGKSNTECGTDLPSGASATFRKWVAEDHLDLALSGDSRKWVTVTEGRRRSEGSATLSQAAEFTAALFHSSELNFDNSNMDMSTLG